jgi:hypothetical protein
MSISRGSRVPQSVAPQLPPEEMSVERAAAKASVYIV